MRKVVAVELVSLDGVMESPEEWAPPYSNDEMEGANAAGMAHSDALLLGRVTYEALAAFWPNQPGGTPKLVAGRLHRGAQRQPRAGAGRGRDATPQLGVRRPVGVRAVPGSMSL